jgi:hypothetical protein
MGHPELTGLLAANVGSDGPLVKHVIWQNPARRAQKFFRANVKDMTAAL